jgi:hypothetical protein
MFNFKGFKVVVTLVAMIVVGHGMAPVNMGGAQGRMMARRAAIVDVYRQTSGAPMKIVSQSYEDGEYTITAEIQ